MAFPPPPLPPFLAPQVDLDSTARSQPAWHPDGGSLLAAPGVEKVRGAPAAAFGGACRCLARACRCAERAREQVPLAWVQRLTACLLRLLRLLCPLCPLCPALTAGCPGGTAPP